MKKTALALSILAACTAPAFADGPGIVVEMAAKAMAKGYGATCSLEMKPTKRNGYYPCIDFGPYRFVKGYGKVYGLVAQKGKEPFLVMSGTPDSPAWIYDGPWQTDMPARIVMFWNDTVEGGAAKRRNAEEASAEQKAAADYIRKLRGEEQPEAEDSASEPEPAGKAPQAAAEAMSPDAKAILSAE